MWNNAFLHWKTYLQWDFVASMTLGHINHHLLISHIGFGKGCVLVHIITAYPETNINDLRNCLHNISLKGDLYEFMTSHLNNMKKILFGLITLIIFKLSFLVLCNTQVPLWKWRFWSFKHCMHVCVRLPAEGQPGLWRF